MAPGLLRAGALALRAASAVVCPASPSCPQDDQCTYTANNVAFKVDCATDFYGGDLELAQTSTLTGCMKACSARTECAAASYVGWNCYMKSTVNAAVANANVIGVSVTTRDTAPPATEPTAAQTCPTNYTCPENDRCSFSGSDGRLFTLSCGSDFYGGDISNMYAQSYQICTQACADNEECVAASFTGGKGAGYCYLKNKINGANTNDNVDAVFVNTKVAESPATSVASSTSTTLPDVLSTQSSLETSSITLLATTSSIATTTITTSTPVSITTDSTSSLASATPSASPVPAPNMLKNPGFELTTGPEALNKIQSRKITDWVQTGLVYPVHIAPTSANSGTTFAILNYVMEGTAGVTYTPVLSLSQLVTDLDVTKEYTLSFFYNPKNIHPLSSCSLDVYLGDTSIFSKPLLTADSTTVFAKYLPASAGPARPASESEVLDFRFRCVQTSNRGQTSQAGYVYLDDVSLEAV